MAKKTTDGGLLSKKLGAKLAKAHAAHQSDTTTVSDNASLPTGIDFGIARIKSVKFGEYKNGDLKGELFFMATATVLEPKEHDGVRIEGLNTQIDPEPLCDTERGKRQSFDEHYAWVLNELRLMGIDTNEIAADDLEAVAEALTNDPPVIQFRTWGGGEYVGDDGQTRQGRVNHEWRGILENYTEVQDEEIQDDTADVPANVPDKKPPTKKRAARAAEPEPEPEPEPETEPETEDLDALAVAADTDGDEEAQLRIAELAEAAGIDPQDAAYASWTSVVTAIQGIGGAAEEPAEEEEEWVPAVKDVYLYKAPKSWKAVECMVTKVGLRAQTVDLKSEVDGTVYQGVAWDSLQEG